eukprot:PhF_6_TR15416/c0_g1_i1/m.23903
MSTQFRISAFGVERASGERLKPIEVDTLYDDIQVVRDRYKYSLDRYAIERANSQKRYSNAVYADTLGGLFCTIVSIASFQKLWPHTHDHKSVVYKFTMAPNVSQRFARLTNPWSLLIGGLFFLSLESLLHGVYAIYRENGFIADLDEKEKEALETKATLDERLRALDPFRSAKMK